MLETRQIDSMVVVKIEPQGIFELLGRKGEVARERLALRDGYDARIGMGRMTQGLGWGGCGIQGLPSQLSAFNAPSKLFFERIASSASPRHLPSGDGVCRWWRNSTTALSASACRRGEEIAANPNKNEDTYRRGKIWYARLVAGDRMIPVRMEFDTAFGGVRGYLAELRGHGVHLHLLRE
jgi:hypothetical protein